jgi:putative ABC transport system ATP-binding protein
MIASTTPVLRMTGVGKRFPAPHGFTEVLRGLELTVRAGEFLMITGPSGSGKSTLLNLAGLLDRPTSGRINFEDRDVTGLDEVALSALRGTRIGMVFQRFCLLPHRSVRDNVLFRFRYTAIPAYEAHTQADQALEQVGLTALRDRTARLLSAGEMQRVAIARAVALRPALLLADEPTGNLDHAAADVVMDCFRALNAAGLTTIMVTHNESLLGTASRHLVCRDGNVTD